MLSNALLVDAGELSDILVEGTEGKTFNFKSAAFTFCVHPKHGELIAISTANESFLVIKDL